MGKHKADDCDQMEWNSMRQGHVVWGKSEGSDGNWSPRQSYNGRNRCWHDNAIVFHNNYLQWDLHGRESHTVHVFKNVSFFDMMMVPCQCFVKARDKAVSLGFPTPEGLCDKGLGDFLVTWQLAFFCLISTDREQKSDWWVNTCFTEHIMNMFIMSCNIHEHVAQHYDCKALCHYLTNKNC